MLKHSVIRAIALDKGTLVLRRKIASNGRCKGKTADGKPGNKTGKEHIDRLLKRQRKGPKGMLDLHCEECHVMLYVI